MDAERYARVRELFLAVEELPPDRQLDYLVDHCDDDPSMVEEVVSLLREHDVESALIEGESAKQPALPAQSNEIESSRSTPATVSDDVAASMASAPFMPGERHGSEDAGSDERHRRRKEQGSGVRKAASSGKRSKPKSASITQHGSQRTHASPRYKNERPRQQRKPASGTLRPTAPGKRSLRYGWALLAAILPTALVGWWTYQSIRQESSQSAGRELDSVADTIEQSVLRYLDDQARLTESWIRNELLRDSIVSLVEQNENDDSATALRQSEHALTTRTQLIDLTGRQDIQYVVWDRTGKVISNSSPDGAGIGDSVAPEDAANLARAMRGETVLFGPARPSADSVGSPTVLMSPAMAEIVPIRDRQQRIVATMSIGNTGMYDALDQLFKQASTAGGLDAYAINANGIMVTDSAQAIRWLSESSESPVSVACQLRVSDPGTENHSTANRDFAARRSQPLTYAVAGAASGRSGSELEPYRNYLGVLVLGSWRWIDAWNLGIIIERPAGAVFQSAERVKWAFLALTVLLTIAAVAAVAQISQQAALAHAKVHPLSRYELVAELGSGGMGVVYRARHGQLGRDTALKVLRGDRDNLEDRLRFDREAKLAASLSNPHTVTIYDYGRGDDGEAYCVMEFLKGITLYDVVARSGFQAYGRTLFILRQICDSLGEAHKLGLVHRDIKPQNVMLSLDASVGDWAVVFDFGLAKPLRPDADSYQTAETIWAGTPMYMAPERYREPNKIDPRSDLYSVGCIAYFLLTGRPPFIECDPESLFALVLTEQPISIGVHRDQEIPVQIEHLVKRCMAKSVDDRYANVDELAAQLDQLIAIYPWTVEEARSWWRIHGDDLG